MRNRINNAARFGRVAVLMGGWSAERQVSLWSGAGVLEALQSRDVDAVAVDADKNNILSLRANGFDRAFNILHGTGGEDGTVQAVLDLQGLPYTGSGVLASALAMDKLRSKRMWRAEGLPTPDYLHLRSEADADRAAEVLGLPLFIKPVADGSSVGISKVKSAADLRNAYRAARGDTHREVLAERFVGGGEYTCGILDGEALPVIRIVPPGEFYDFDAKYLSDATQYHCPAGLADDEEQAMRALSVEAFELIGGRGWGRVDLLLDGQRRPWLLEINTLPGMTSHSLLPMAAKAVGMSYADLCWALLETTLETPVGAPTR
jgi:D-alanine-D-alanine ligase